jgi:pimeloyl-ACP methyl ester carboxylesterase
MSAAPLIERCFVQTPRARIHIATAGTGFPVLLLHQTPRSWDEYRDVLPLLAARHRAIAMDTAGFGDSTALPFADASIESWADCAFDLLDALSLPEAVIVGHHTGAAIAIEMAAARPDRVAGLVLSSPPYVDAARRERSIGKAPPVDTAEPQADGSHLLELWRQRQPLYPPDAIDLLRRYMADALKAGPMASEGHRVVNRYVMETRLSEIRCPTLVIDATEDHHARPVEVARSIEGSFRTSITGGMVPLPDQMPEAFAAAVLEFLDSGADGQPILLR